MFPVLFELKGLFEIKWEASYQTYHLRPVGQLSGAGPPAQA